jgi:hypothetical protein
MAENSVEWLPALLVLLLLAACSRDLPLYRIDGQPIPGKLEDQFNVERTICNGQASAAPQADRQVGRARLYRPSVNLCREARWQPSRRAGGGNRDDRAGE